MVIDWDVAVTVDDGMVSQAEIFRPGGGVRSPVILSCRPYWMGLSFQEGYPGQWGIMVAEHPDVAVGFSDRPQNWETCDSGEVGSGRLEGDHRQQDVRGVPGPHV